jgi:hypothetical protein
LLNYAVGYTAITVKVVATVKVKATADSAEKSFTVPTSHGTEFKS